MRRCHERDYTLIFYDGLGYLIMGVIQVGNMQNNCCKKFFKVGGISFFQQKDTYFNF